MLEALDQVIHFLLLLAISPFVLSACCWAIYGRPAHTDFVGRVDKKWGEVLEERPRRPLPSWAT